MLNLTVVRHPTKKVWFLQFVEYFVCGMNCLNCRGKFYWIDQHDQAWAQREGDTGPYNYGPGSAIHHEVTTGDMVPYHGPVPAWVGRDRS